MGASERLRDARQGAGFKNAAEAATALGVPYPTYAGHENGSREYDFETAERYGRRYGVRAAWLLKGEEPRERRARAGAAYAHSETMEVPEPETRAGAGSSGAAAEYLASSENGIGISADVVRDVWGLPRSFVRGELHISGRAAVVEVFGDSGYDPDNPAAPGSLYPGDRVVVDLSDRNPSPPGPFLVWDGIGLVVKLVEVVRGPSDPGRIRLKSRNPRYEAYEATQDEATILGRVRGRISAL